MTNKQYIQELAEDLTSTTSPLDIILALDSSASMINQSNESKEIAIDFLKLIENKDRNNIRIGYVSWNHNVTVSEPPVTDYKTILNLINKSPFSGNTCFSVGINKSLELLNKNALENAKKAIVLISDGNENCNKTGVGFECSDLERISESRISFYAISTTGKKTEITKCLENYPESLPNTNSVGKTITEVSDESADPFILQAIGRGIQIREVETNVSVTKTVKGGKTGPLIVLKITAPPINDIKNAIVLALDSSGSFGSGGRPDHGAIVRNSVSNVLSKMAEMYPKTNISILSWDDNIDFAYFNLTNKNASQAKMIPIKQAEMEFRNKHVFIPAEEYQFLHLWKNGDYTDQYYDCRENESTNLNVGIQGAIDILDANYLIKNIDREATPKSIIFVTGRSEFTDYVPNTITDAAEKGYKIYPVGLGVMKDSLMHKSLKNIAQMTGGVYKYSPNSLEFTEEAVSEDILGAIRETLAGSVIDNITITESLYPYLKVTGVYAKPSKIKINSVLKSVNQNTWEIRLMDGLSAEETIEVYIETELNMHLPVDITENMTAVHIAPMAGTFPSVITFNWRNVKDFNMPLPENSIII